MRFMKVIPYGHQMIGQDDIKSVVKILKSYYITQGPTVGKFEDALCEYTGAKYAVCVSNGTAALHLACLSAGIRVADEVITTPITFAASANSILYCGGRPIFADVQKDTANIEPFEVVKNITKKTKAIIPVHFSGHPCDLKEIRYIANKHDLLVIEDAAHALGAEYQSSKVGSCRYSDLTIFSFHPVKSITTGEGGAVLTNRRDLYEKLLLLRNHGITKKCSNFNVPSLESVGDWYYEMQELGFNYRLTDIQAALGISQIKKLDRFVKGRREIAKMYDKAFKGNPFFDIPVTRKFIYSSYHLYCIRLKNKLQEYRKEVFCRMRNRGIGVQVHYIPVYLHPYYKSLGFKKGLCMNAEDFYSSAISIPLYPSLKDSQVKYIINTVLRVCNEFN